MARAAAAATATITTIITPVVEFAERPEPVSAKRTWECDGQTIAYTATAGHIDIREDCGKPIGSLFSVCSPPMAPTATPTPPAR